MRNCTGVRDKESRLGPGAGKELWSGGPKLRVEVGDGSTHRNTLRNWRDEESKEQIFYPYTRYEHSPDTSFDLFNYTYVTNLVVDYPSFEV